MGTFFLKFEAIESRIASYSCPRGIPSRVHALRLRRCFQNNGRRLSAALGEQLSIHEQDIGIEPGLERPEDNKDTVGGAQTIKPGEEDGSEEQQIPKPQLRARRRFRLSISRTRLERQFGEGNAPQVLGDVFRPQLEGPDPDTPVGDEAALYSALETGDPHTVLHALLSHAKLNGFGNTIGLLVSIPPATFSEILRCIDPKHFVGRYEQLHREISPTMAKRLGLSGVFDLDGYYKFCSVFLADVQTILEARHRQNPVTLSDYKYLLRCARATGNASQAEYIWASLKGKTKNHKLSPNPPVPDAECYNLYLSIKCWHDSMNPLLRFRLRVIPDNFGPRSWSLPPYSLKGHTVRRSSSLRSQVSALFREMVGVRVTGNEETFCLMAVALAREGDMPGVASILQRVWDIDVQRLMTSNDSETPPARVYRPDSPFYPSSMLLDTIAHAYGINNQIPTALRLIDYVSGQYSIPIPTNVWNELLQWTFVLSIEPKDMKRQGEVRDTGKEIGLLPPEAVTNLWKAMVSEPYNVKPTMEMYNRLIINLWRRQRYGEMQVRMEEARSLLKQALRQLSRKQVIFNATTLQRSPAHLTEQRMRDLIFAQLRVRRNRMYVERWVRLLITHPSRNMKYDDKFSSQNIPNIIKNWSLFVPFKIRYSIRSGLVTFRSGTETMRKSSYLKRVERSKNLAKRRLRIQKWKCFTKRFHGNLRWVSIWNGPGKAGTPA
jgi:hypothetical protein